MRTVSIPGTIKQQANASESTVHFAELFRQYYPRIYNYLRYRVALQEDAEDLANIVFERAYTHRESFNPEKGAFSTWLFRIAHNTLANYHRSLQRRLAHETEGDLSPDLVAPRPSLEVEVIQRETITRLLQGLERLNERDQEVISLKFAGQLTNKEIGQIMSLREKTVSVVLWRAMRRLQQQVEGDV